MKIKGSTWVVLIILVVVILILVATLKGDGEGQLITEGEEQVLDTETLSDEELVGFEVEDVATGVTEGMAGPNKGTVIDPADLPDYSVEVSNQAAGSSVTLATVSMAANGWVVIHEDMDGAPGNILGAQRFDAGAYEGGRVELLRSTVSGGRYYAMLHLDDGDKSFDHKLDLAIRDGAGNLVVMMDFIAQ